LTRAIDEFAIHTLAEDVTHDHAERNHQGIGNALIDRPPPQPAVGRFDAVNESAGFSATTIVPHRTARPLLGQYGVGILDKTMKRRPLPFRAASAGAGPGLDSTGLGREPRGAGR
jgi:hypothetical protein